MLSIKIGLMGAGRMATALARGLVRAEMVPAGAIVACDPSADARKAFASEIPGTIVDGGECRRRRAGRCSHPGREAADDDRRAGVDSQRDR